MEKKRVLAMYDVRGKQKYIYRSNHIKEMIGASCIIRDVFKDYLYDAAKVVRNRTADLANQEAIYNYKDAETEEIPQFSLKEFEGRMSGQQYIGEVVYDGGGNFFVLYQDKEICREINKIFTKELMKKTYALKVLCTFIEDLNYRQYREDNIRLYQKHRINEAQESVIYPVNSIPIVQTDYLTSRPLSVTARTTYAKGSKPEKLSLESYAKYLKYEEEAAENEDVVGEKVLDRIITEKGKESLLAVIYIDGNNMGVQVQNCLKGKSSYEECVNALRKFSNQIQKIYVDNRIQAINGMLDKKYEKECHKKRRTIVLAGDEMTIICNARDVMEVVKAYFKDLPRGCSSCAGIAIFHSHAPYADAYRLAEECCEEGKSRMKKDHLWNADFVDFHYCQGGMGNSLKTIREREWQGEEFSRPWLIHSDDDLENRFYYTLELVEQMAMQLQKIGHSNVKSLLTYAKESPSNLMMELERINAHREEQIDFSLDGRLDDMQIGKLLYDIILVYDLWYREEGK